MKKYNKILDAINRGIKFALDDFEDQENIQGQVNSKVKYNHGTKEWLNLMSDVVDLGLPSGTLWCKYNLGCETELLNEEGENSKADWWQGDYFAWGINQHNDFFTWGSYDYADWAIKMMPNLRTENYVLKLFKYCYEKDTVASICDKPDNKMKLDLEDDAAYVKNNKYCIPSTEQFLELLNNTKHKFIPNYNNIPGLNGILFTSIHNQNTIFFPLAGYMNEENIRRKNTQGFYWTCNLSPKYQTCANSFNLTKKTIEAGCYRRDQGCSIRPVLKQ